MFVNFQSLLLNIQKSKRKSYQFILLVILISCSITVKSQPADTLKQIYKVGFRERFEPFEFLNKSQNPDGLTADLLREISKLTHVKFEFVPMTFKQSLAALADGEVDLIPLAYTPERVTLYGFSDSYCQLTQAFFQNEANTNIRLNSLAGTTIGFVEGDVLLDTFATRTDFKKQIVHSKLDGFMQLKHNQIDGFFCSEQSGIKIISEYDIPDIKMVSGSIFPREYAFATNKNNKQLILLINGSIAKLKVSGKLQKLTDKWLSGKISSQGWLKRHESLFITILVIFTVVIIFLMFWNWLLRSTVFEKTKSIKESEEKYRDLIDNSPDAIVIYVDGIVVMVNNECLRLMRAAKADELLGKNVIEFIHPDYRLFVAERMKTVVNQQSALPVAEEKFVRNDGSLVDVEVKSMSITFEHKLAVQLIVRDITDRKKAEEELRGSEEKFRSIFDESPIGIELYDANGKLIDENKSNMRIFGITGLDVNIGFDLFAGTTLTYENKEKLFRGEPISYQATYDFDRIKELDQYNTEKKGKIELDYIITPIKYDDEKTIHGYLLQVQDITERIRIENLLKANSQDFQGLFDNAPIGYHEIDNQGRITRINKTECNMLGYTVEELIGQNVWFLNADASMSRQAVEDKLAGNFIPPESFERDFITKDGRVVPVLVKDKIVNDFDGRIIGIRTTIQDVTEIKIARETLLNERLLLRTVIDNIPDAIYAKDLNCAKTLANLADIRNIGVKSEIEVLGKTDFELFPKELAGKFIADDKAVIQTGHSILNRDEYVIDDKGNIRWLLTSKLPLYDKDKRIIGLVGIGRDITEQKLALETLENERLLLRTVIDNIPDAIYAKDLNCAKTLANLADIRNIGAKSEIEVLGKTDFELFPQKIAEKFIIDDQTVIKTGIPVLRRQEYVIDDKGNIRWLLTSKLPLYDKDKRIIGLVGVGRDITEQKLALETLENERLLLRTVIDNIPDPIYAKDINGVKTVANMAEVKLLGAKSESEVVGKDDFAFYPKEVAEEFKLREQLLLQTGVAELNMEDYRFDDKGNKIWLLSSKIPLRDKNGLILGIVGVGRNITTRKQMEESLRESEEHYRTLVERMPDGVYKSTHDGHFVTVNPAMVKLLGYDSMEELLSINIKDQLYFIPTDREDIVLDQELGEIEIYRLKKKDGSAVWIEDHGWYSLNEQDEAEYHEGVMRDITSRLEAEQALSNSREELKSFAAHLQNVREEERLQLANEIHDEIGQILIAIKIDMGILKQKTLKVIDVKQSKDILPKFESLLGLLDNTINTTRKIMTDNRQEVLHLLGFIEAAQLQVNNFQEKYQISCQFVNSVSDLEINSQQGIALFRILQEALSNVGKYAKATQVNVNLFTKEDKLILDITDNGIGFSNNQKFNKNSYGLIGMKERAFLLEGELFISSQLGIGTNIRVEMPYKEINIQS